MIMVLLYLGLQLSDNYAYEKRDCIDKEKLDFP